MRRSCSNCYFYEECGRRHVCGYFSPLQEVEVTEREIEFFNELEKEDFREYYWRILNEEDRLQDYFG